MNTHNYINYVSLTVELGPILHIYSATCFIYDYLSLSQILKFIIKYYILCQQQPAYKEYFI
jgi:hypothetical protein